MLDSHKLYRALTGVVGLYNGFEVPATDRSVTLRQPSVYLSDAHRLLRPDVIDALGPRLSDVNPDQFYSDLTYSLYDVVTDNGQLFESQTENNYEYSLDDPAAWRKISVRQAWYNRIERGAINKLALFLAQNPPSKALFDTQVIFQKEGNLQGAMVKLGRFVGVRVKVKRKDAIIRLSRIGLQLTGFSAAVPVYVFHSEQNSPVNVFDVAPMLAGRTGWADAGEDLYGSKGGYYLIGYFESDLPIGIQAVGSEKGFTVAGCSSCGGGLDQMTAEARSPFVDIEPIYVSDPLNIGTLSWSDETPLKLQTWGLNFVLDGLCDTTTVILEERESLTNALLHTVACDVLEDIASTTRLNGTAARLDSQAYIALKGQKESDKGLAGKRDEVLKAFKETLSLKTPCVVEKAAKPTPQITFGSVWD